MTADESKKLSIEFYERFRTITPQQLADVQWIIARHDIDVVREAFRRHSRDQETFVNIARLNNDIRAINRDRGIIIPDPADVAIAKRKLEYAEQARAAEHSRVRITHRLAEFDDAQLAALKERAIVTRSLDRAIFGQFDPRGPWLSSVIVEMLDSNLLESKETP